MGYVRALVLVVDVVVVVLHGVHDRVRGQCVVIARMVFRWRPVPFALPDAVV